MGFCSFYLCKTLLHDVQQVLLTQVGSAFSKTLFPPLSVVSYAEHLRRVADIKETKNIAYPEIHAEAVLSLSSRATETARWLVPMYQTRKRVLVYAGL